MRQFIIDGSCKEIAIGAGIVEVDGLGFLDTHTFNTFHVQADPILAEIYALDCTLQLIETKGSTERHFEIYTDNQMVYRIFNTELYESANDIYIDSLRKQVILLKKFARLELKLKNEGMEHFAKMAHLLSRNYLEHQTISRMINQSISLKVKRVNQRAK